MAVGAGVAVTVGEKGLGPGERRGALSVVSIGGGASVVVVVVVVVVVSSGAFSSVEHDALNMTIATAAAPPATAAMRRPIRADLMLQS
ncbi:hypothetical protein AU198_14005 [Mycobacterium sp. GA-1199]|nr:hypothetical protein AU198_14005 [Mycobacterium sp. GA-1199]